MPSEREAEEILCENYMVAFLELSYELGLSPFKIEKRNRNELVIITSNLNKVTNIICLLIGTASGIHQWSLIVTPFFYTTSAPLNLNDYKHRLVTPISGIMRAVFMYSMWSNQELMGKLFELLESDKYGPRFYNKNPKFLFLSALSFGVSVSLSFFISIFGLNVIPPAVLQSNGWGWRNVFLGHEHGFNQLLMFVNDDDKDWHETYWSYTTIPLGLSGMLADFCTHLLDARVYDCMLLCVITLYNGAQELKMKMEAVGFGVVPKKKTECGMGYRNYFLELIVWFSVSGVGLKYSLDGDWARVIVWMAFAVKIYVVFHFTPKIWRICKQAEIWWRQRILDQEESRYRRSRRI